MRRLILLAGRVLLAALAVAGCQSPEDEFTEGRLENLCAGTVPVCNVRAGCVLSDDDFVRGTFPGAQRYIVATDRPDQRVEVRLFFTSQRFPGTELLVQLSEPGCGRAEQTRLVDIDFFARAGDDGILDFSFDAPEKGDHLLEVFSDMSAGWLLTVDVVDE